MSKTLTWIKITRPGTLFAAMAPVLVALFLVAKTYHKIDWLVAAVTFACAIFIQIISNMVNDLYDYRKGLDEAGRVGPRRGLAENLISVGSLKFAIFVMVLLTFICGAYLFLVGGVPILVIGIAALFFAWLYTATRFSLSYLGIADVFVFLFFGPVATAGTVYLQTSAFVNNDNLMAVDLWNASAMVGSVLPGSIALGVITGLISMAVLTVNNIRDIETDAKANKKTIPVRIGKKTAELYYLVLFLIIIPCLFFLHSKIYLFAVVLYGIFLFWMLTKAKGREYNNLLVFTGLANVIFVILYAVETFTNT